MWRSLEGEPSTPSGVCGEAPLPPWNLVGAGGSESKREWRRCGRGMRPAWWEPPRPFSAPPPCWSQGSGLHGVMVCEAREAGKLQGCLCGQEGEKAPRRRTWGPPQAGPSPPDPPRRSLGPRWSCLRLSGPRGLGQPGLQHCTQQRPLSSPEPQSCTPPPPPSFSAPPRHRDGSLSFVF